MRNFRGKISSFFSGEGLRPH